MRKFELMLYILLDLSKAFDKVVHNYLILKLEYYGVRHQTSQWVSSFLSGRTQYVTCNGSQSSPIDVISGVPQGTVLGPLLFLIYINDLPNCVVSSCSLFADDCLLYRQIRSQDDCCILQNDLLKMEEWANTWMMTFNVDKCEVLQISLSSSIPVHDHLYNNPLRTVKEAKYLGVLLDSKLNFNKHIETICKKANSVLGFLKRNLYNCNPQIRSQAYMLYIRPILEYASTVWAPYTKSSIEKLEAIQRRAARFVVSDYDYSTSVTSILNHLNWPSLDTRRQVSRLVMFYKIVQRLIALDLPDEIELVNTITRGHNLRYRTAFCRVDVHKNSFFPATIRRWNGLPEDVIHSNNLRQFRISVNLHLTNQ